jgi:hypothetical protein
MPSSTRQATPGPSSTLTGSRDCSVSISNTKKRAGSEDVEDTRHSKKTKVDGEPLANLSMNAKGKKKRKKKRKKRTPAVVPEVEPKERVKSKSRTPSNKPASVGRIETITNGPVDDTKHMAHGDGKPPHVVTCSCRKFTVKLTIMCSYQTKERAKLDRPLQPRRSLLLRLTLK